MAIRARGFSLHLSRGAKNQSYPYSNCQYVGNSIIFLRIQCYLFIGYLRTNSAVRLAEVGFAAEVVRGAACQDVIRPEVYPADFGVAVCVTTENSYHFRTGFA